MAATTTTTTSSSPEMRMAPRSPAVASYLRNFECERLRLQEVLEVTLCYGVFCLSQNFSLKGMSVEELRAVTKYDAIRKRDFFVRNAGISARRGGGNPGAYERSAAAQQQQQQLRGKPSHSWRDGNEDADILKPPAGRDVQDERQAETAVAAANRFLSDTRVLSAENKQLDEIDFFTTLFGKQFIDTAWATFAGRNGSQIASKDALLERFTRIDQRKAVDKFPALELPVASFVEFLSEYVKVCVAQQHQQTTPGEELEADSESALLHENQREAVRSALKARQQRASSADPIRTRPSRDEAGRASRHPPVSSSEHAKAFRPKTLQHVQSKIKPELDARREKLLRVKKTQTQLMKESLARTRLAEYEVKRMLDAAGNPGSSGNARSSLSQRTRKMPLADISTGAAALEIAEDFMRSPLLDSFSEKEKENRDDRYRAETPRARGDPLREELYGAAPLDDSFLGCKPPPPRSAAPRTAQPKKPSRAYSGWLGDFGPQHTKTVVSEWGTPADEEDSDGASEAAARKHHDRQRSSSRKFEWKFDSIDPKSSKRGNHPLRQRQPSEDDFSSVYSGNHDDDADDGASDGGLSEVSDPVFKWLKKAV